MLQAGKETPAHLQAERLVSGQSVSLGGWAEETSTALPGENEETAEEKVPLTPTFFPSIWRLRHLRDLPLRVLGALVSHGEQRTKEAM